uniref:Uncharacterized protein n=1 Tax=Sphaerodactylus townsendi TaxID=933632 RepID=A0ACB8EUK1_9SAUR
MKNKVVDKPVELMKDKVMDKPMEVVKDGSQVIPNSIIPGRNPVGQLDPRRKPPSEQPVEGKMARYHKQYSTFKRNYALEETVKLINAAKKNVVSVWKKIVEEIKCIVGSQCAEAMWLAIA